MIKFITKFLAKRWLEKHKDGNLVFNVTNFTITGYEFFQDLLIYFIIFGLIIIGLPIGIFFLTHSVGWTIFLGVLGFIIGFFMIIITMYKVMKNIHGEILYLIEKTKLNEKFINFVENKNEKTN